MTNGTLYSYSQHGDVILTSQAGTTRNIFMNTNRFKLSRGSDTVFRFFVKDNSGRPIQLTNQIVTMNIIEPENNQLVLKCPVTITDDMNGIIDVSLSSQKTDYLMIGLYHIMFTWENVSGNTGGVLYSDRYSNTILILEVTQGLYPITNEDTVIDSFDTSTYYPGEFVSSDIQSTALVSHGHISTVAIYTTAYTGSIRVEATLAEVPISNTWFDVSFTDDTNIVNLTNFSGITIISFEGSYQYVRFIVSDPVDKILYRA